MKFAVFLLRYIRGYVSVSAEGGFTERFLNLCHSGKINLWDVCLNGKTLTFCVCRRDFIRLRSIAKKSGVRIKIRKKTGLIYKYRRHSKRIGLLAGLLLFAVIHIVLSMFVWCTDVQGNTKISKNDILARAEHYGLTAGTRKKGFDEILAARKIAAEYNGRVTWLSINIKGSLAVIELREDNSIITETQDKAPCNIVADFDGVILSAETFYGDCMVKSGTGVRKGDLLISGAIVNEDMSTDFYAARGKITALHEKEVSYTSKPKENGSKLRIVGNGLRLGFFGLEIPIGVRNKCEEYLTVSERKTLNINGYNLPFYIERLLMCDKSDDPFISGEDYIYSLEKMQSSIYKENANSTVISSQETVSARNGTLILEGKYTLIDFLGEEKPILSSEGK